MKVRKYRIKENRRLLLCNPDNELSGPPMYLCLCGSITPFFSVFSVSLW